jgi:truncated hemoglobin YjbI
MSTAGTKQAQSLFGGTKTIESVVDQFYVRMLADND